MARSVGEAAAVGLESGFRLAMDVSQQRRQQKRQERADQIMEEDRLARSDREGRQSKLAALTAQEQMLAQEGQGYANSETPLDEAGQADFARRVGDVRRARGELLAQESGYDIQAARVGGAQALETLQSGGFQALKPGQFTQALTVATGRSPKDFMRVDGKPSKIEQALQDFSEGMDSGDKKRILAGLNTLLVKELRNGVGQDSPQGGKIVGKRIVDFALDPSAPEDKPRVIPTLEVFVNTGKDFRGPIPEGVPEGATASYRAPVTQNRSTDPNDPVRAIDIDAAMEHMGKYMQLVDLINSEDGQRQLQLDREQGGWNPDDYTRALTSVGAAPKKKEGAKVQVNSIPAGGSALVTKTDSKGNITSEVVQGNPKTSTAAPRRGTMQQQLDAIDELEADGTLTPDEAAARKKALAARVSTGTKAQGLAAGGGGGAKGGGKGPGGATDKEIGRRLQYIKEQRLALEKKRDLVMAEYKADLSDDTAGKKEKAAAKTAMQSKLAKLDSEDDALRANMTKLEDQLALGPDDRTQAPAPKPAPRPAGGGKITSKEEAAARFGFTPATR